MRFVSILIYGNIRALVYFEKINIIFGGHFFLNKKVAWVVFQ